MKQIKVTVEISDVRTYGTLDNTGSATMHFSSEDMSVKEAVECISLDQVQMLAKAASASHWEQKSPVEEGRNTCTKEEVEM